MQTMMCCAGFFPDVGMMILLASVVVMDVCMLIGPTAGWSETVEYDYLSQYQFPFARNIISYVLGKCENLVGVMMFGHKAADNILPWLRDNYSKKILIQNMFLNHPQNIKFSYTLEHAQNYVDTFRAIMALLGVDIPPLDGHVQLRFLMSKKRTLEMRVCVKEFVDSAVLEAVQQRTDKVKISRMAKVEEMIEKRKEPQVAAAAAAIRKEMQAAITAAVQQRTDKVSIAIEEMIEKRKETQAAAVAAITAAVAAARRKEMQPAAVAAMAAAAAAARWKEMQAATVALVVVVPATARREEMQAAETSCVCSHVGCIKTKHARGVCRDHGPRCRHDGCKKNVYARGFCQRHLS